MDQNYPEFPAPGHMSVTEYAVHRQVSDVSIYKYIRQGFLKDAWFKDKLNRTNIDPKKADQYLDANETVHSEMQKARRVREKSGFDGVPRPANADKDEDADKGSTYTKARTGNEVLKYKMQELSYKERVGELIDGQSVKEKNYQLARTMRENMMSIPDRVAAMCAAERDETKIRILLKNEITKAISETREMIKGLTDKEIKKMEAAG